jgi:hypothetical protein
LLAPTEQMILKQLFYEEEIDSPANSLTRNSLRNLDVIKNNSSRNLDSARNLEN